MHWKVKFIISFACKVFVEKKKKIWFVFSPKKVKIKLLHDIKLLAYNKVVLVGPVTTSDRGDSLLELLSIIDFDGGAGIGIAIVLIVLIIRGSALAVVIGVTEAIGGWNDAGFIIGCVWLWSWLCPAWEWLWSWLCPWWLWSWLWPRPWWCWWWLWLVTSCKWLPWPWCLLVLLPIIFCAGNDFVKLFAGRFESVVLSRSLNAFRAICLKNKIVNDVWITNWYLKIQRS